MLIGQLLDIANLNIFRGHNAWPLRASAQEPFALPKKPRRVERRPGNQQLDAMARLDVRSDDDTLGSPSRVQQEELERIAEVIMIELIVADAVGADGGVRSH